MKWCPRCERNRPLRSFGYSSNRAGDGLRGYCRDCWSDYYRERRQADPRAWQLSSAVSAFRKFRDDPEFWQRVQLGDERAAAKTQRTAA